EFLQGRSGVGLLFEKNRKHRSLDVAGANCVAANILGSVGDRKRSAQRSNAALGCTIGRQLSVTHEAQNGGGQDETAAAAFNQSRNGGLTTEVYTLQIDALNLIPHGLGSTEDVFGMNDCGIGMEDIEAAVYGCCQSYGALICQAIRNV